MIPIINDAQTCFPFPSKMFDLQTLMHDTKYVNLYLYALPYL